LLAKSFDERLKFARALVHFKAQMYSRISRFAVPIGAINFRFAAQIFFAIDSPNALTESFGLQLEFAQ
jgi:hypothetical protein